MQMNDRAPLTNVRRTQSGFLVADVRCARTGVQEYAGSEVGRPDLSIVRLYRSDAEVFGDAAMASFAHRPVTNDHPGEMVGADNWKRVAVGQTGGEVQQDGKFVRIPMSLMDADAIKDFENGKVELSMGYVCEIEFVDGISPSGERYDAIQKNIRANHLALVDKARGGSELRIGDQAALDDAAKFRAKARAAYEEKQRRWGEQMAAYSSAAG